MHDTTVTNCLGWNASNFSLGDAEVDSPMPEKSKNNCSEFILPTTNDATPTNLEAHSRTVVNDHWKKEEENGV